MKMEVTPDNKYKCLNRDVIKYIAMVTMLLNHIATIFMSPGSLLTQIFLDIGYFTAISMCYFLVEGYQYTHSKKRYAFRLAIFALLSEIPYCLAFAKHGGLESFQMNMLFTLLLCFFILVTIEKVSDKSLKMIIITGLVLLSSISDWALYAPIFTLLFVWSDGSKPKLKITFLISMFGFGLMNFAERMYYLPNCSTSVNLLSAMGTMIGIALSGIAIIYLYNGKRMEKGKAFSKWFFYLFYPAHLLILGIIRLFY